MGSAALVLDGPGGERVLRAGLEGLAATTKLYPKTLAVRVLPASPCSHCLLPPALNALPGRRITC